MIDPRMFFVAGPPPFAPAPADPSLSQRISKLAEFAARNGPSFVEEVRAKQAHNPDFAFLNGGDGAAFFSWSIYRHLQEHAAAAAATNQPQQPQEQQQLYAAHHSAAQPPYPSQHQPPYPPPAAPQQQQQQQQQQRQLSYSMPPAHFPPHSSLAAPPHAAGAASMPAGHYFPQQPSLPPPLAPQTAPPPPQPAPAIVALPAEVRSGWGQVLKLLGGSRESITQSQAWFMACAPYAAGMAAMTAEAAAAAADYPSALHLLYLANDILFAAKSLRAAGGAAAGALTADAVAAAWRPLLGRMLRAALVAPDAAAATGTSATERQQRLSKIANLWAEREIYPSEAVEAMVMEMMGIAAPVAALQPPPPPAAAAAPPPWASGPSAPPRGPGAPLHAMPAEMPPPSSFFPPPSAGGFRPQPPPPPLPPHMQQAFLGGGGPLHPMPFSFALPPPGDASAAAAAMQPPYFLPPPLHPQQQRQFFHGMMGSMGAAPPPPRPPPPPPPPPPPQEPPFDPFSFPPGLIPRLVESSLQTAAPYSPLSPLDVERSEVPPPPREDAYLKARLDKFYAQLADFRPGMSFSDIEMEAPRRRHFSDRPEGPQPGVDGAARAALPVGASDGSGGFSGRAGGGATGLGYGEGEEGGKGDVFESYRKMRSQGYHQGIVHSAAGKSRK